MSIPAFRASLVLALVALAAPAARAAAQAPGDFAALRPALEGRIARHQGTVGVALIDPSTGEELAIRGDEPFPTASVIKIPILVEVFHQVEAGRLSLDDPLTMLAIDRVPGSGVLQFLSAPHHLTMEDAAFLMIALSDNTATNLVVDKVGIRAVNARMDSLGYPGTALFAEVFRRSATTVSPDSSEMFGLGVTTPLEMARLLASIEREEVVSPEASRRMLEMMGGQFYGDAKIPRHLPAGTRVAHKTGDVNEARHDCGVVDAGERDWVLCVFTKENADTSWRLDNEADLLIADLSRLVHQALAGGGSG